MPVKRKIKVTAKKQRTQKQKQKVSVVVNVNSNNKKKVVASARAAKQPQFMQSAPQVIHIQTPAPQSVINEPPRHVANSHWMQTMGQQPYATNTLPVALPIVAAPPVAAPPPPHDARFGTRSSPVLPPPEITPLPPTRGVALYESIKKGKHKYFSSSSSSASEAGSASVSGSEAGSASAAGSVAGSVFGYAAAAAAGSVAGSVAGSSAKSYHSARIPGMDFGTNPQTPKPPKLNSRVDYIAHMKTIVYGLPKGFDTFSMMELKDAYKTYNEEGHQSMLDFVNITNERQKQRAIKMKEIKQGKQKAK